MVNPVALLVKAKRGDMTIDQPEMLSVAGIDADFAPVDQGDALPQFEALAGAASLPDAQLIRLNLKMKTGNDPMPLPFFCTFVEPGPGTRSPSGCARQPNANSSCSSSQPMNRSPRGSTQPRELRAHCRPPGPAWPVAPVWSPL
jgi:hypothetical protein